MTPAMSGRTTARQRLRAFVRGRCPSTSTGTGTGTSTGDDGQVMLLSIAFGVLALLLVTAVVSATSIHLERTRLVALADLTALAAADSLDVDTYYSGGGPGTGTGSGSAPPPGISLTSTGVRDAVAAHLARSAEAARFTGLSVASAGTPDGRTAEVTLAAVARPALLSWVTAPWSDGVTIVATAHARAD